MSQEHAEHQFDETATQFSGQELARQLTAEKAAATPEVTLHVQTLELPTDSELPIPEANDTVGVLSGASLQDSKLDLNLAEASSTHGPLVKALGYSLSDQSNFGYQPLEIDGQNVGLAMRYYGSPVFRQVQVYLQGDSDNAPSRELSLAAAQRVSRHLMARYPGPHQDSTVEIVMSEPGKPSDFYDFGVNGLKPQSNQSHAA